MNFNKAEFFTSYGEYKQIPPAEKIEIAFAGRSNVGKSTLINKVLNRKSLARVSSVPGKTATINFFKLEDIFLVDLPGYGFAKRSKSEMLRWSSLIEGYLTSGRDIALIFQLVDMRHSPSKDDLHMISYMIENEVPFVIILTKADKLTKNQRLERLKCFKDEIEYFEDINIVEFSGVTGEGVDKIREIIEDIAQNSDSAEEDIM